MLEEINEKAASKFNGMWGDKATTKFRDYILRGENLSSIGKYFGFSRVWASVQFKRLFGMSYTEFEETKNQGMSYSQMLKID
jgi:hypothetical protein